MGIDGADDWGGRRWPFRAFRRVVLSGRYGRLHRLAVDRLFADEGDRVLDLGCGPGLNTGALARAVGRDGRVVGLDARAGAVRRAREEAARVGDPCSVIRGDTGSLPFPTDAFDRAFSTLGMGGVPDAESAVAEVARALRPGGRFAVLRARPFPTLPLAFLGPFVDSDSTRFGEQRTDRDVRALLEERFDVVHVESFGAGSAFVATAEVSGRSDP